MTTKILGKSFFERKTETVAKDLLGKYMVRKIGPHKISEMITEVEAYLGPHDLACHASKGRTARTEVMFEEAGTIYIYFIYGMHWMLNIVTEKVQFPAAILIRGTENFKGPGILTRELKIGKDLNGKRIGMISGLWFEERDNSKNVFFIDHLPRIGVNYAGPIWSQKKLRFLLKEKGGLKQQTA